jgi:hypothetical protein
MHSKQCEENKVVVAALFCFICGFVCDLVKHQFCKPANLFYHAKNPQEGQIRMQGRI